MGLPWIQAVAPVLPPHFVTQEALLEAFVGLWKGAHFNVDRLVALHKAVQVGGRHLALPLEAYPALVSFQARNDAWIQSATQLSEEALRTALAAAGLPAQAIDALLFVTVTGVATPSVDARLVNRLSLRPDVSRWPLFGLGCVAGAAGLARAAEVLRGAPGGTVALVAAELCSLTLQREDVSIPNIIASGLFGDGGAAVVLRGGEVEGAGPRIVATRSVFYPDTERMMGWDVTDSGFKVVLSAQVPRLVLEHIRGDVDSFLGAHGTSRADITHWVAHTGGPKVLEAFQQALELPPGALEGSWRSLREVGNLSSASVLFVLGDLLASGRARPGELGLLLAMGPGFCAELVLLRW